MFNTLSDDLLSNITTWLTISEMFATFCINKENNERSQEVLDRRYKMYRVERATLHRFHFAVQSVIENWRIEKQRRISIPMYNNRRRLRTEETPVMMF